MDMRRCMSYQYINVFVCGWAWLWLSSSLVEFVCGWARLWLSLSLVQFVSVWLSLFVYACLFCWVSLIGWACFCLVESVAGWAYLCLAAYVCLAEFVSVWPLPLFGWVCLFCIGCLRLAELCSVRAFTEVIGRRTSQTCNAHMWATRWTRCQEVVSQEENVIVCFPTSMRARRCNVNTLWVILRRVAIVNKKTPDRH